MNKLKKVTLRDIIGIFKFIILIIPALIFKFYNKINHKEIWLICETENTARDNGYAFFKYLCKEHPEINVYYAISKKCEDYKKIENKEKVIKWSSLKHYLYYMSSKYNISSHKEGNPNHSIFTVLHLYLHLYNNRIFLQHGILYQNLSMFHYKNTRFKLFITGAKPEYEFIKEKYGYPEKNVVYTGLARFDTLDNKSKDKQMILYMPTWRRYFNSEKEFINSLYYKRINSFINNKKLNDELEKYDKYLYFQPHIGLKDLNNLFKTNNSRVIIVDPNKSDVQEMLKKTSMLITDFSSIHSDVAYLEKPIIYYQYDLDDFNNKHIGKYYKDTYYDYKTNGFGPVVDTEENLIDYIIKELNSNLEIEEVYKERIHNFYELHDNNNCERIFKAIKEISK